jgi:hypothetical protein
VWHGGEEWEDLNRQDAKGAKVERFQISVFSFQFSVFEDGSCRFNILNIWQVAGFR